MFKFQLEKGSRKFICPRCNRRKLVRYVNVVTNEYLPEKYGRCDSDGSCRYFEKPFGKFTISTVRNVIYLRENEAEFQFDYTVELKEKIKLLGARFNPKTKNWILASNLDYNVLRRFAEENDFFVIEPRNTEGERLIPLEILNQTLDVPYDNNALIQSLIGKYTWLEVFFVIRRYYLGTINEGFMKGSITFPFIDSRAQVRAIQVKLFGEDGHTLRTSWAHSLSLFEGEWKEEYKRNESVVSCLFGEHLLHLHPDKVVCLVESPKTAIVANLHFGTEYLWLAVFNKQSFKEEKISILKNRKVVVFPDADAYPLWEERANQFGFIVDYSISEMSNDERKKWDLADYILSNQFEVPRFTYSVDFWALVNSP